MQHADWPVPARMQAMDKTYGSWTTERRRRKHPSGGSRFKTPAGRGALCKRFSTCAKSGGECVGRRDRDRCWALPLPQVILWAHETRCGRWAARPHAYDTSHFGQMGERWHKRPAMVEESDRAAHGHSRRIVHAQERSAVNNYTTQVWDACLFVCEPPLGRKGSTALCRAHHLAPFASFSTVLHRFAPFRTILGYLPRFPTRSPHCAPSRIASARKRDLYASGRACTVRPWAIPRP